MTNCKKGKSQPLSLGESLHQTNRGKMKGGHLADIQMGTFWQNTSLKLLSLLKNIGSPCFLFRLTNAHSAKSHSIID